MRRLFCILALLACLLQATTTNPAYIPNSTSVVTTRDATLKKLILSNVTAGAITVTISDRSTRCNSAACQIWPAVSIAANTVYVVDLGNSGVYCESGFSWSASGANSVIGIAEYVN